MNITLAIDNDLAARARKVAEARGISLNQLVREELERVTSTESRERDLQRLMTLLREHPGNSQGQKWTREDAYDRAIFR